VRRRRKTRIRDRLVWPAVAAGSALAAGAATRAVMRAGWRVVKREKLPDDPARARMPWGEALAWAVATGALAAGARLAAERGAAAGWKRATGARPPRR